MAVGMKLCIECDQLSIGFDILCDTDSLEMRPHRRQIFSKYGRDHCLFFPDLSTHVTEILVFSTVSGLPLYSFMEMCLKQIWNYRFSSLVLILKITLRLLGLHLRPPSVLLKLLAHRLANDWRLPLFSVCFQLSPLLSLPWTPQDF